MMSVQRRLVLFLAALVTYGCSSAEGVRISESITVDENNPKRIRFVVHGDPGLRRYAEINNLPLPMHEKIREGMRRYAADELRDRGWCPNGFTGPEIVWASESSRLTRRFFVDCL
jgi:hypothetical protein